MMVVCFRVIFFEISNRVINRLGVSSIVCKSSYEFGFIV